MTTAYKVKAEWNTRKIVGKWAGIRKGKALSVRRLGGERFGPISHSIANHILTGAPISDDAKVAISYSATDLAIVSLLEHDYPLLAIGQACNRFIHKSLSLTAMRFGLLVDEIKYASKATYVRANRLLVAKELSDHTEQVLYHMNGEPVEQYYGRPGGRSSLQTRPANYVLLRVPLDEAVDAARRYRRSLEAIAADESRPTLEDCGFVMAQPGSVRSQALANAEHVQDYDL
jgi:hypothetical protein